RSLRDQRRATLAGYVRSLRCCVEAPVFDLPGDLDRVIDLNAEWRTLPPLTGTFLLRSGRRKGRGGSRAADVISKGSVSSWWYCRRQVPCLLQARFVLQKPFIALHRSAEYCKSRSSHSWRGAWTGHF